MNWLRDLCLKIGWKDDLYIGNCDKTLYGLTNSAYKHMTAQSNVVPDDCTTLDVTAHVTPNTFGDFVQVIKVNSGSKSFRLYSMDITDVTENGLYIVEFHKVEEGNIQNSLEKLATVFSLKLDDIKTEFFSDLFAKKIYENNCSMETLMIAEEKVNYLKSKNVKQGEIKFNTNE